MLRPLSNSWPLLFWHLQLQEQCFLCPSLPRSSKARQQNRIGTLSCSLTPRPETLASWCVTLEHFFWGPGLSFNATRLCQNSYTFTTKHVLGQLSRSCLVTYFARATIQLTRKLMSSPDVFRALLQLIVKRVSVSPPIQRPIESGCAVVFKKSQITFNPSTPIDLAMPSTLCFI